MRTNRDRMAHVDSLLSDRTGHVLSAPSAGFGARVTGAIQNADRPGVIRLRRPMPRWPLAAAACLVAGLGAGMWLRAPARPEASANPVAALSLGPHPVMRLVSGTLDQPLRDEAEKMVNDTRRATRAMVQCVPFTRTIW